MSYLSQYREISFFADTSRDSIGAEEHQVEGYQGQQTTPIIDRIVLKSLGCNNRAKLIDIKDKHGYEIKVSNRLGDDSNKEEKEGRIASM